MLRLATELHESGIDVILDKWDLKEGNDAHAFMEKIVTDPEIKKVILISDKAYVDKTDGRSGGVGKEAQIISGEIYEKQDQDKFVAVIKERGENGKPYRAWLVEVDGMTWGLDATLRGASERLAPILMTALVTGLGLLPLAIGSGDPGREIEGPMATVILGGLITSTLLNLLVLPTLRCVTEYFSHGESLYKGLMHKAIRLYRIYGLMVWLPLTRLAATHLLTIC